MLQLRELVTEILNRKFPHLEETKRPRALANAIDVGEMDIRRAAGIEPGSRRNQEKVFQLTLRLLELSKELGIDPAAKTEGSERLAGVITNAATNAVLHKKTRGTQPRGTTGRKK